MSNASCTLACCIALTCIIIIFIIMVMCVATLLFNESFGIIISVSSLYYSTIGSDDLL